MDHLIVLIYGNVEGLLIGDSLGSTYGKVIGSDEGIKLGLSGVKVLETILWKCRFNHTGYTDGNSASFEGYSCCHSYGLSCHRCSYYPQGRCDGRHC